MHAFTGKENGNPFQYSCLENPRNRETWWAATYGVTKSWTGLKRLSSSSSSSRFLMAVWNLPYLGTWSSAYLRLLIFLPAILIPACASSSPASLMMYSAYKLNNQGDNIQPWCTAFPIWNQSVVPVLTVACWPAYRFLKAGQVVCYSHLFQNFADFGVVHTVKDFDIVNKAELDDFLALSCFFDNATDVGNLISGSPAFSKTSLNIWKFTVHELLKPGLENFEHYITSMWDECNCVVVWALLTLPFLGIGTKTDFFQSCGHYWVFHICWHIECNTFTASPFRIGNSSTGVPSCPLALFIMMLPKAHLNSHSRTSGSRWLITPSWLSGS